MKNSLCAICKGKLQTRKKTLDRMFKGHPKPQQITIASIAVPV